MCFIAMGRTKVRCKHGVHPWFQTTMVCLCSSIRLARNFLRITILQNHKSIHETIVEICIKFPWEVSSE